MSEPLAEPILYEMHMHTPLCKHARGEPEDYAAAARGRGLKGIVVTCHNPTNDGWSPGVRMSVAEFEDYLAMVERARTTWSGRVDVRLGIESDYVPGMEPWLEKLHDMAEFHHVLGSVHPHLRDYQERYFDGEIRTFQRTYFEHLAMAAETGLFDTIAHPDLVKNVVPFAKNLTPAWNPEQEMDVIRPCLDRIAAMGTAMELNTSGLGKPVAEMNPARSILQEMHRRGIPVVIGADAHDPHRVGADFEAAIDTLGAVGYACTSIFLDRRRIEIPLDQARSSLRPTAPAAHDSLTP
ncbi:MAG: histidinol-phosphatase [Candidatus Latescibacterota bacterium]|jgi:histidinol-phosphatase (PHP family)|nr:histidinol-phosphatase [Candidatus Latescibacterota bacterium]